MQRSIWKYFFSLGVLLAPALLFAQDRIAGDSSRYKFLPTGIRVGTDVISLVKNYTNEGHQAWEVNVDADFYRRYYATVDVGRLEHNITLGNGLYTTDGGYFRIGVDVNFLLKDPERNMFFAGFRWGHANYSDRATFTSTDDYFGTVSREAANSGTTAGWKELTAGLRVKIWKAVWLGATGRIKLGLNVKGEGDLKTYEVPGYGLTFKNSWFGFNYQVLVRIPIRKQR